jgi:regulator of extracellular matrix RemA (YlzA/DUF370 family)
MYINLGADNYITSQQIVGVFDADNATYGKKTLATLNILQSEDKLITITNDIPRSIVLTQDGTAYLSALSSATLKKRMEVHSIGF